MDGCISSKRKVEAQRESSAKRLNVTVGSETLDCIICSEPLRPPIFQCSMGHFICSLCGEREDQLDYKCPKCSIKTSLNRCFGMEHVVQSVTVACPNDIYGCAEKVPYYKIGEHKKACKNAPCFCPECCYEFSGPTKVLLDHFTTQHKCPSTNLPEWCLSAYNRAYMFCNVPIPATFSCSAWPQSLLDMPSQSSASNQTLRNPGSHVI